jgi:hypothetical protein
MSAEKSLRYEELTQFFLPETYKKGHTDRRLSYFLNIVHDDPNILNHPLIHIDEFTTSIEKMQWKKNERNKPRGPTNEKKINPEFVAFFLKMAVECNNKDIEGNNIISILSKKPHYSELIQFMLYKITIPNSRHNTYYSTDHTNFIEALKNRTLKCKTASNILIDLLFFKAEERIAINRLFMLILFNDIKHIFKYLHVLELNSPIDIKDDDNILMEDSIYYKYKDGVRASRQRNVIYSNINGELTIGTTKLPFTHIIAKYSNNHNRDALLDKLERHASHQEQYEGEEFDDTMPTGEQDMRNGSDVQGARSRLLPPYVHRQTEYVQQPPAFPSRRTEFTQPQTLYDQQQPIHPPSAGVGMWPERIVEPELVSLLKNDTNTKNDKQYFIGGGYLQYLLLSIDIKSLNKTIERNKDDLSIIISKSKSLKLKDSNDPDDFNFYLIALNDIVVPMTSFSFQGDKAVLHALLNMHNNKDVLEELDYLNLPLSSFFAKPVGDSSKSSNERYFRKEGLLYVIKDGKEHQVTLDEIVKLYNESKKCHTSGFQEANDKTCASYFMDCLDGRGIESCKEYLKEPKFWEIAKEEVRNMIPELAVKTLKAFGFKLKHIVDPVSTKSLITYETVNQWLQNLKTIADDDNNSVLQKEDYLAIQNNDKLLGYLYLVTEKLRLNPAILNPDFEGAQYPPNVPHYKFLDDSGMGSRPSGALINGISVKYDPSHLTALFDHQQRGTADISIFGGQIGSGPEKSISIDILLSKINSGKKQSWSILKNHYEILRRELNSRNKDIAPNDNKKIQEILESIKQNELMIAQIIFILEKYINHVKITGDELNEDHLRIDELVTYLDKHKKTSTTITNKRQILMKAFENLASILKNL